jgi:hypothetical protein
MWALYRKELLIAAHGNPEDGYQRVRLNGFIDQLVSRAKSPLRLFGLTQRQDFLRERLLRLENDAFKLGIGRMVGAMLRLDPALDIVSLFA